VIQREPRKKSEGESKKDNQGITKAEFLDALKIVSRPSQPQPAKEKSET
jgi:hypothetical protein